MLQAPSRKLKADRKMAPVEECFRRNLRASIKTWARAEFEVLDFDLPSQVTLDL
jgi:hypothetical protein